jgi:hypothetical protein
MKQNTKQLLGVLSFNPEKRRRIVDRSRNSNFHRKVGIQTSTAKTQRRQEKARV